MTTRRTQGEPSDEAADRLAVEAAHRAYYDAWERGDVSAVGAAWLPDDDVCCVFPGGEPTVGAAAVRAQVEEGVALTPGIQFLFEDVDVRVRGDVARLTCIENAITPGTFSLADVADFPEEMVDLPSARLAVTSTFVRTADGWKLWMHTVGPVLTHLDLEE